MLGTIEKAIQLQQALVNCVDDAELDNLLLKYNKLSTPELPVIASVLIHLNNLFESSVAQVQKTRSKAKSKKKKKGFFK